MPLAAWNIYLGISYYWAKSSATRSLEALISVNFRFLTFINIGSTCAVYTRGSPVHVHELSSNERKNWSKVLFERTELFEQFFLNELN